MLKCFCNLLVSSVNNASEDLCIIPAQWNLSKLNSNKQSCFCASQPEPSDSFRIHLSERCSVRFVSRLPAR